MTSARVPTIRPMRFLEKKLKERAISLPIIVGNTAIFILDVLMPFFHKRDFSKLWA